MSQREKGLRTILLLCLLLAVFGAFVLRLMRVQIVEGESYRALIEQGSTRKQIIEAARGEIVDRNGTPLSLNATGYNIVLDKAFLPTSRQNSVILELTRLLQNAGEVWIDNLPISRTQPFAFEEGEQEAAAIARLKKEINVQESAPVDDVLYWLAERYRLQEFTPNEQRTIAGVRYEMERRGFNIEVPYTFAENVSITTVAKVKERSFSLEGTDVLESPIRQYAGGDLMPHILGFTGPIYAEEYDALKDKGYKRNDTLGKAGIEKAFEDELRGSSGTRSITINAKGDVIDVVSEVDPVPGNTVVLTIDKRLQRTAADALEKQIINLQNTAPAGEGKEADSGAVVLMHCKTGEILAAVNYPSYDRETYRFAYQTLLDDPRKPLINRAVQGTYAAGSIYKPSVATAALATGVVAPESTINCTRVYTALGASYQPKCLSYHGPINVLDALRYSCNIFFYESGRRLGIDTINKFSAQYGLGQPTGIEIPETVGELSSPESKARHGGGQWYEADTVQSAIGQLYNSFSPLQMANYAATIGNRGKRMETHLVRSVESYTRSETIKKTQPVLADTVQADNAVFETVIEGMVRASRIGTAQRYFGNYPIDVASKTGTPETVELPNSTFIAFAPANDPEIAIAVLIEKGWHGYTGAPVAKEIFDAYFYPQEPDPLETDQQRQEAQTAPPVPSGSDSQDTAPPAPGAASSQGESSSEMEND